MPVSTTSYKAETVLEAAVLCDQHGLSYFKRIENTLQDLKGSGSQGQPHEQTCSVEMMRKLITTIQEQLPCLRFWQVEIMVSVIKHIAASTQEGESDGLSVLLDNGLMEVLALVFEGTRRHISQIGKEANPEADHLMEVLFETINDVAEYSGAARKLALETFCARLIKLVLNIKIVFHTRMEAERTLNLLLEGCEDDDLGWVSKDPILAKLMQHLAEFLPVAGDFEMQIAVTESLARMVTKSERRRRSPSWFPSEVISAAFLAIEDQQFDSDCRTFLNLLNKRSHDRGVYSFSCNNALMGDYELRNPSEDKLSDFWVDFNAVSQCITMYVADEDTATEEEGGLWETVTFSKDKVKEYIINEDQKGCIVLIMTLTEPASSILAFAGSESRTATITFEPGTDLVDALAISIGLEKNAAPLETPSSRRSSVSKINVLVNRARNTSWGLSNMPQSFNDGYVEGAVGPDVQPEKASRQSGGPHVNEAKATPVRRKISIPLVPMTTPTRTSFHSTTSSFASSLDKAPQNKTPNQGFTQPRTPTGPNGSTKKVKTPLQITVADKPSTSGTENDLERPNKAMSTTPAKVSVTKNNIVCETPVGHEEADGEDLRLVPDSQDNPIVDSPKKHHQGAVPKKSRRGKPVGHRDTDGEDPSPVPDSEDVPIAASLAKQQQGAVPKKTKKGKSGKGKKGVEDHKETSSSSESIREKECSGRDNPEKMEKGYVDSCRSKRYGRHDSLEASSPKQLSQDISKRPETQSQSLDIEDNEVCQDAQKSKGRKKDRKAPTNPPPSVGSRRSTRSSKASQKQVEDPTSCLPLQPKDKEKRGKRFKLYSDESLLINTPEADDKNERSKTRGKGKKPKRGNDSGSDPLADTREYLSTASEEKAPCTKKGKKKEEHENLESTKRGNSKLDKDEKDTPIKAKGASKQGRTEITGPLMIEDNLSQDFVAPAMTAKGKPTRGVNGHAEREMTSHEPMYNPEPHEDEENLTSPMPQIDERAAAQALAAENAEYCVPSSAPEERCSSLQGKEEIIPDSQPNRSFFRRSGRFPSPMLSDITEEGTLSSGAGGPKHAKQLQSPHISCRSDSTSELMVIKSKSKPQTAQADSTSLNQQEKDPYSFDDASTVSSLPVLTRKTPMKDGAGDADNSKAEKGRARKHGGSKKERNNKPHQMTDHDVAVEDSSQDEFTTHSITFGLKNKGSVKIQSMDKGKRQHSTKVPKTSSEVDGAVEPFNGEVDDLIMKEKPRQSSRKRMKGKLDSDDAYIQRIQRETKASAEFATRMQDQEEDYPDIEVARDVANVTEAYKDTDISSFVKSVMKSLPKHRSDKNILKHPSHGGEKSSMRKGFTQDGPEDKEAQHAEKEHVENAEESTSHHSRRSSAEAKHISFKLSPTSPNAKPAEEQGHQKPKEKVPSGTLRKQEHQRVGDKRSTKSSKKSSRKSIAGDESLTEGEMSVDDMVSAHIDSILSNRGSASTEKHSSKKDRVKEKKTPTPLNDFEIDRDVLRRAEDSISRRSKMVAALKRNVADECETEQDEGNCAGQTEKTQRKRSIEKKVADTAESASKLAKRLSLSSTPENQFADTPASTKVQSLEREGPSKHKHARLDQSDDEDMYDYDYDIDDLSPSRKKNKDERVEQIQKDRNTKKNTTVTAKTATDDTTPHSRKNRRSMNENMYDYDHYVEDLSPSRQKNKKDGAEQIQKDRSAKKSTTATPKTTIDDTTPHSKKNRRSREQEEVQLGRSASKAVTAERRRIDQAAAKSKVFKGGRTHFGSQIEETESEEIMETASTTSTSTPPDDTSTVVSVASFSNMCKDLLKSSGKGIAAGRKRRKLQKVDYTELENSCGESDDGNSLQTPSRCVQRTACEKQDRDIYEFREETTSSCHTASIVEDAVSELSWLADKPKHKVSTYSKTRTEVYGLAKITKNLDTVKKPRHQQQIKQNVNAPKKRKSQSSKEPEEEDCPLYYYGEEEQQETKKSKKKNKKGTQERDQDEVQRVPSHQEPTVYKKPKSSCRRSLVECMSSSINQLYDSSQDAVDEDDITQDHEKEEEEEELEEEMVVEDDDEDRIPATPAMTIETVTSQMSAWTTPGSISRTSGNSTRTPGSVSRTPKQVSFVDELESFGSDGDGLFDMEYPVSGPSKSARPSESTLKRKYGNLLSDEDDDVEDEDEDENGQGDGESKQKKQSGLNISLRNTSSLEPKILFKDTEPTAEEVMSSEHSGEDGVSDRSVSSSWGQNMDFPSMQMPEMFGFMRNRIKQKMMMKRDQTQKLTDTAIQSTQKQMNKLFLELHKARQKSQNDFQHKLLTELVGMESNLEKLSKVQTQNEHILKQYSKKSTQHVEQHLSKVERLHTSFLEKGASLGADVMESLQQVINKEMKNMLKKMLQDMQQEQMKKTMQSLFLMR